jgi:hypothetical protein
LIIKHFTAEEIKTMADFYGSPAGKSAMSKFGDYMADLMAIVQSEKLRHKPKRLYRNQTHEASPDAAAYAATR